MKMDMHIQCENLMAAQHPPTLASGPHFRCEYPNFASGLGCEYPNLPQVFRCGYPSWPQVFRCEYPNLLPPARLEFPNFDLIKKTYVLITHHLKHYISSQTTSKKVCLNAGPHLQAPQAKPQDTMA